jgi:hypothetical protein
LISASTCAAAVPPWLAGGLGAVADPEGRALVVLVTGAAGRGDGEREDAGADGDVLAGCGGTVTTAGVAARAKLAALPGQGLAAAPHRGVAVGEATPARPDAAAGDNAPRAR